MRTTPFKQRVLALTLSLVAAVATGVVTGAVSTTVNSDAAYAYNPGGKLTLSTVRARANWWLATYGIVYSQEQTNAKSDGTGETYRPDCTGFVSMAWHLPKKPNGWDLYTGDFWSLGGTFADGTSIASVIRHIPIGSLQAGDAIFWHRVNPDGSHSGHARLFDGWANLAKTQYYGYEEFSSSAEARRIVFDTPPLDTTTWRAARYNRIVAPTAWSAPKWCQYKVVSGTVRKRSGPGLDYTGEGTYSLNQTFIATFDTMSAGGKTWRQVSGSVWVTTGDPGSYTQSGGCLV